MRSLMWFTIGFTAACAISIYLGIGIWLGILSLLAAVLLLLIKKKTVKVTAVILLGIAVGMFWTAGYRHVYLNTAADYDAQTVCTTATICDYSYETSYGVAADGYIELADKRFKVRLYYPQDTALEPGDRLEGDFRLRLTTYDSKQGGTYHQGEGVFLLAYGDEEVRRVSPEENTDQYFGANLRRQITRLLTQAFPADTLGFANALLIGDSSLLDYKTDTDFKISGIRHVIAVSGLHVSILMCVIYLFTAKKRYLSAMIGIPVLFLFAAVVGFTPSVVRACIMQALVLLALLLNKEYDPPTALSFAVLVMLAVNPMTVVSVSFQMSCGCLIGIFLFYEKINRFILCLWKQPKGKSLKAKLLRWFSGSVAISLSTMITTAPLSAVYFGAVSIVGVLTNLLTLWVISYVFCAVALVCVAGVFYLPLAKLIAWVISWPIRYVCLTAKLISQIPFAAVYTCSIYIVLWLVMGYLLLGIFLLSKRKHPRLLCISIALGLVLSVTLTCVEPMADNYRVTVFDVGEGQAILVECAGRRYMVDCGGDSDRMAAETVSHHLLSRAITGLDGIILTHYDRDHAGGLPLLLTGIRADTLYLPDVEDSSQVRSALEKIHSNIQCVRDKTVLDTEEMKITILPGIHSSDDNERSLCILFQVGNCDILITGDRSTVGEKALLADTSLPELELLVVGHHGAQDSTGLELLTATKPKAAVISVGADNFYGHPSEDVLRRLALFGCKVWRTDLDGNVIYKG